MHTDPIADMLTRIRNAQAVGKTEVILPYSKLKHAIAELLSKEGWLANVTRQAHETTTKKIRQGTKKEEPRFDMLKIGIKYNGKTPKIAHIARVSKPGRRVYVSQNNLPRVLSGFGVAVISTSKGLMTNTQARKQSIGGEVICEVY